MKKFEFTEKEIDDLAYRIEALINEREEWVCKWCGNTGTIQGDFAHPEGLECDRCNAGHDYKRIAGKYGRLLNDIEAWLAINTQPTVSELTKMRKSIREALLPIPPKQKHKNN